MARGLKPMRRRGIHWELAQHTVRRLRTLQFLPKTRTEHGLEGQMVNELRNDQHLNAHIISQLDGDRVEKVEHARMLGFRLRPDATIGRDGTAIELKKVQYANALRDALGQALVYRRDYRFVIMCLVDRTSKGEFSDFAAAPQRPGRQLLQGLADDLGIFTVIAPHPKWKRKQNIILISESS